MHMVSQSFQFFKTERLKELRGLVSYLLRFSDKLTLDGFCSQLNLTGTIRQMRII